MAWFAELAGKAENLLNNIDEQTGAALRKHNVTTEKNDRWDQRDQAPKAKTSQRPLKKHTAPETKSLYNHSSKKSPTSSPSPSRENYRCRSPDHHRCRSPDHHRCRSPESQRFSSSGKDKSQTPTKRLYTLNKPPRTLVSDIPQEYLKEKGKNVTKERRNSHPSAENNSTKTKLDLLYAMENLEIENTMLKNEINVMNTEASDLLDRAHVAEEDLMLYKTKIIEYDASNKELALQNKSIIGELEIIREELKRARALADKNLNAKYTELEDEARQLKDKKVELENLLAEISKKSSDKITNNLKVENDFRHAQTTIKSLSAELEKSNAECKRLERDWESYKHRVKSMLGTKDKQIKALQDGVNHTEDTKILVDQIDNLTKEREGFTHELSNMVAQLEETRKVSRSMESKYKSVDRVVQALRSAINDERAARNRIEAQCSVANKELKHFQLEYGKVVAGLRAMLRDKEHELDRLRENAAENYNSDSSALNVGAFVAGDACSDQIQRLTQTLIQRQTRIDSLLADKNMLTIQLENLETKHRKELQELRSKTDSVLHFQELDRQHRSRAAAESGQFTKFSRRIGVFLRQHPLFRIFMIIYMIGLHLWVFTVLLTSASEIIQPANV